MHIVDMRHNVAAGYDRCRSVIGNDPFSNVNVEELLDDVAAMAARDGRDVGRRFDA
jgi:hypothetical protein